MDGTYSVGSKHSTPRYRTTSARSNVDESLFGNTDSKILKNSGRRVVHAPVAPSAVVISQYELERLKSEAVIKSEAQMAAERDRAMADREAREMKAKERKERMRDLEKKALQLAKKSDVELAAAARQQALRECASEQLDQNSDVVKLLNSMAQRAAAYSIRDKQLEEKKRLEEREREFDRRADIEIEMDRLKDLQRRESEETFKRSKRIEDRKVINDQIESRQKTRLLALEAREQENIAMRNLMKKYEDEDVKVAAQRRVEIERSRVEVIAANEAAIARKQAYKQREKEEQDAILAYQAMKDAELRKREEEEAVIERAKKERQAKLLAQQERAQNNAGKLDELRARRAAEERERREREKERVEAIKRKAEMEELLKSRAQQAMDKQASVQKIRMQEEDEIAAQMAHTLKMDEREREEQRMKAAKVNEFRVNLQKQIEDNESMRSRQRAQPDAGGNIREELLKEEERLKVIRDKMVRDLEHQGVNPKYLSEMRNVDVGKILRR